MKKPSTIAGVAAALIIIAGIAVAAINLHVHAVADRYVVDDLDKVPSACTCLVLGAAVYRDGTISDVLYDRLTKAIELYRAGKVRTMLLSGDHGTVSYDEVNHMRDFMMRRGVSRRVLYLDHAGLNTYNSMARARGVYNVDECIVVTQRFHLPRALYIARKAGLRAWGFPADRRRYLNRRRYVVREIAANVKAFIEITVGLGPHSTETKIPITGCGPDARDAH